MSTFAAQALQQALVAASQDSSERARAISALRGSEVFATTWPTEPSTLRTLLNSSGLRALALFTDRRHLEEAALRYGWQGVEGQVAAMRLHISEALRFARQQQVPLVIVDLASEHALELDEGEMELLSSPPSSRPPSYRGLAGVVSTPLAATASEVKRVTTHPPAPDNANDDAAPSSLLKPSAVNVDASQQAVSATFGLATTATMAALPKAPSDDLLDALCQVLREYPEVEWACLVGEAERPRDGANRRRTAHRSQLSQAHGRDQRHPAQSLR